MTAINNGGDRTSGGPRAGMVELKGSKRKTPPGRKLASAPGADLVEITVRFRRKNPIEPFLRNLTLRQEPLSPQAYREQFGAAPEDVRLLEDFAKTHGLVVQNISPDACTLILKGTLKNHCTAFRVELSIYQHENGIRFRGREGSIWIPEALEGIVLGVFGLDTRPQAHTMFRFLRDKGRIVRAEEVTGTFNPPDLAGRYGYPSGVNGTGECIALIELGGGFRPVDLQEYFAGLGLPLPKVSAQSVDGGVNQPTTADSADGEVALDIEVAGGIASGASFAVYFAPNTDQGFLDAINAALHDPVNRPSVISISWGSAESDWTEQAISNFDQTFQSAAALGVSITCAAGDGGSADGQTDGKAHTDFPSSSPHVLACGGTHLGADSETVWNDGMGGATGGGISDFFAIPDYQQKISIPASVNDPKHFGRGLPDVAANADPTTGYNIRVDGQSLVVGGTSAVAPLMAGLLARCNQKLNRRVGFVNPGLYGAPGSSFKDITVGNNNTALDGGYSAGKGWDACSGLGVVLGTIVNSL